MTQQAVVSSFQRSTTSETQGPDQLPTSQIFIGVLIGAPDQPSYRLYLTTIKADLPP